MMLPTHAVVGLAIAAPLVTVAPELASVGLAGGLIGGIFPDLDMYAGHRKTLHFPTLFVVAAIPVTLLAAFVPQPPVVGAAFFLLGAAAHCQMDRFGGGLELKPWEGTSERGVYDHVRGRWRRPKRWIPYDGSPHDLALLTLVSLPLLIVLEGVFQSIVGLALVVGGVYVGLRRRLAILAPVVFSYAPEWLSRYVPERYRSQQPDIVDKP